MMNAAAAAAAVRSETAAGHFVQDNQFNDVDAETRQVMRNRVNPGVNLKYETENVKFMIWLFDNRDHYSRLLKPALLNDLAAAAALDRARKTKAGRASRLRDHIRAHCRRWLGAVDAERPDTHPIELAALTWRVYCRYLNTFKKSAEKRSRGGASETVAIRLSGSAFDGSTSALTHLYTGCGLDKHEVSKELWTHIKIYKAGSKRTAAREKKS